MILCPLCVHFFRVRPGNSGVLDLGGPNKKSLEFEKWPGYDESILEQIKINIVVQFNGRTRGLVESEQGVGQEEIEKAVLESDKYKKYFDGKEPKKIIFVSDKIINFII